MTLLPVLERVRNGARAWNRERVKKGDRERERKTKSEIGSMYLCVYESKRILWKRRVMSLVYVNGRKSRETSS